VVQAYSLTLEELYGEEGIFDFNLWGEVRGDTTPWFKTLNFGWVYLSPESTPEGYWIWSEDVGWFYSSNERFPEAFVLLTGTFWNGPGWILFDLTDASHLKYYIFSTKEWITIPRSDRNSDTFKFERFDLVPEEIRGVVSSWWIPHAGGSTKIGNYLLVESIGTPDGLRKKLYYYDSVDGWFYPYGSETSNVQWFYKGTFLGKSPKSRALVTIEGTELVIFWEDLIWGGELEVQRLPISSQE
jgi:hypothetical protein